MPLLSQLLISALLLAPTSSFARIQGEVSVGYELGYDDNINLGADGAGQDENISNEIYTEVDVIKDSGFFQYNALGRAGFRAETADGIDDRFLLDGNFDGQWMISRNRLAWDISNEALLRRTNSAQAFSVRNTEQINRFRTGPRLFFRPGPRTNLELSAFYEYAWFEERDDNQFIGAAADLGFRLSSLTQIDTNLSQTNYLPEGDNRSEEVSRSVSFVINRRLQRGNVFIGAGVSTIELDLVELADDEDEIIPTYRAAYDYEISSAITFNASFERAVITVGRDEYDIPEVPGLSGSTGRDRPGQSGILDANERSQLDDFDYTAGFNVSTAISTGFIYSKALWSAQIRGYSSLIEVPDTQFELTDAEERAYFETINGIDRGSESIGFEIIGNFEPKPRWLVSLGYGKEYRTIDTQQVNRPGDEGVDGSNVGLLRDGVTRVELDESRIFSDMTYAATRFLSFGARLELAKFEDVDTGTQPGSVNRIFFNVEYVL